MATKTRRGELAVDLMATNDLWNRLATQVARATDPLNTAVSPRLREQLGNEAMRIIRELQSRGSQYELFPWEGVPGGLAYSQHRLDA